MRKRPGDLSGPPHRSELMDQNQPDYASQVTAALGIQGRVPAQLDTRFQLGFNVDDFTDLEFALLRRRQVFEGAVACAAVAGQQGSLLLLPGWGVLVKVESVQISNLSGAAIQFTLGYVDTPPYPAAVNSHLVDGRGKRFSASSLNGGSLAGPTALTTNRLVQVAAGGFVQVDGPWILNSGNPDGYVRFGVQSGTVMAAVNFAMRWSERALLPSEV